MGTNDQGRLRSKHSGGAWRAARALLLVALLAMFVSVAPSRQATAATPGLVAAYGFDEGSGTSVTDASGNGNNGTISNATWAATGKYGKALQFNGSSATVNIPDSASLHLTTGMTLEAWVNPSTVNANWRDVIYKGNDNYYLEATSSNASKPDAGLIAGGSYADAYGTAALTANSWSYLTETYDGSNLRLYVNGTLVATTAHTGSITTSTNQLQIGGDSIYGQYFAGMIDEVRIYNTALTATQSQTDMTTPINPVGPTYSVGGSLSGLSSGSVVLQDNGGDDLSVSANGPFTFATKLASGAAYAVTVKTNPSGQTCSVSNGSGTVGSANVTSVSVACTTVPTYSVGGSLSGLSSGSVVLQDNGGDDLSVSANGPFTFATKLASGAAYAVTVKTNPSGQTCSVSNGSGTVGSANVTNVAVSCAAATGPSGLVAAYGFDEGSGTSVTDASGNGNNGTISNATWAATGKYGKALQFNGSSATVNIPDSASLHLTTGMTLEAWVNPSTVNANWRDVIYKGNDNYYLEATSSNASKPDAGLIAGGSYADAYGTAALTANSWSYLTETYDGSNLRLYVNGTLVATTAHTGSITTSTNQLQIGGDSIYGQYFAGMIDEVRIYNTALTATQSQTDMTTPINPVGPTYSVGGSLSGLSSGSVVLQDNGGDDLSVSANGPFTFATKLASGAAYAVTVKTNPSGQTCSVSNGSGTVGSTNVTSVSVACTTVPTYSVGGSLSGLSSGSVVLQDNGGDDLSVSANGPFTFATKLASGAAYAVTVKTNPSGQTCSVSNGSGTVGSANVTNVAVSCAAATGPSGLVAAYGFDEGSGTSVTDASGNGNNGTISNATWAATGKYGKALQFNGSSATVNIPDSASLHLTTGMTLEAWVNPSTVNANWRDVIYKGNDNYYLEATSSNASKPDAGLIAGGSYADAYGTAALTANSWSYLTETYDGSNLRLYVNGTLVATTAHTGSITTSTNQLQIGGDSIYGQYFAGMIDEVRIYNTALTATQIQTDQTTPVSTVSAPGTLSANPVSSTEVDLSWGAATGGAAGYQIERCSGVGCSNFSQIGTTSSTTYKDTTVTNNNTYSYRVRATDSAGNPGPYSNTSTATTALTVSPNNIALTFTRTQQFTAQGPGSGSVTWLVDGIAGGGSGSGTITAGGLYTPPSSVGTHTISATAGVTTASVTVYVTNDPGTFMYHNDNMRTGQDLNETVLTPSNVKSTTFGKLFSYPLDSLTLASPVYIQNVNISGQGYHNIVIVATEHDSVYAFDADGRSSSPLWHVNFTNPAAGVTTVPAADTGETADIPNEIGITSTPVIDPTTGTVYVVAKTKEVSGSTTTYVQRLHALDIATGAEKPNSPVVIQASVPGSGNGSSGGTLTFNPLRENQRTGLLLANGIVYFGFSSHGDNEPFHGWVFGYNASTLQRVMVYCTTPNGDDGGVWMDGDGIATDATGSLYFISGDGLMDANTGGGDYGDSFLRLSTSGTVQDYFSPSVQSTLDSGNLDLGAGGVLLLPDQSGAHPHEMVSAGKNGTVYLVDRDNMGHYNASSDQIVQSLVNIFPNNLGIEGGNFSSPVYWNGNVYFAPVAGPVQAFKLTNGLLSTSPTSKTTQTYDERGGTMSISANGSSNGILWTLQTGGAGVPGILHAYDATDLTNELYNSNQAGSRDALDEWDKFSVPVVANGEIFVTSTSQLTVYGLFH